MATATRTANCRSSAGSSLRSLTSPRILSEFRRFQRELIDTRAQIREVQHNLRKDIARMETIRKQKQRPAATAA